MGLLQSKKTIENFSKNYLNEIYNNKLLDQNYECPICLEKISDITYLNLSCNHTFCLTCLQKCSINFINFNSKINCPICREIISNNDMKKIFKVWVLYDYFPNEWRQFNIINLSKRKITKFSLLNLNNNVSVYFPFYNHYNFEKILLFYSPLLENINLIEDINLDKHYSFTFESYFKKPNMILKKFIELNFLKNKNSEDILNMYKNSKFKIRFCVKDLEKIIILNKLKQTREIGFRLYNQLYYCLFKTYLLKINNNFYLINELYAILYV